MSGIKDFNHWMTQYYGNNDYGYRPQQQNRLSDLVYKPQQFSYTNADFQRPDPQPQYYQAPQQQIYQQAPQQTYQPRMQDNGGANINYFTLYNGELIPTSEYVRRENARVRGGGSSYD